MTDYAETTPPPDREWRGPRTIAQVKREPGQLNRIVFSRLQALAPRYETTLPLTNAFTPPASKKRIPASMRDAVGHFRVRASGPFLPPPQTGPLPSADDIIRLRQQAGLSQRDAAAGAGISRSMVSELEHPRSGRNLSGQASKSGEYVAWLRRHVAKREADAGTQEVAE